VRWRYIIILWLLAALYQGWWLANNPLPDGFQNEYLLLGNAMDLWGALTSGDIWHMRWYMYTGYWPWGFYAVPWPFMAVLGATRTALVMGNLIHLGVLLAAVNVMGRALGARWAPLLLLLCPGVFGTLVRFEPNLADIAWTAAGLAFLVRSRGLQDRKMVLGWGASLGLGLMMDRLSVGFFLVPAVVPLLWRADRRAWANLGLGLGLVLLLTGAYYREFFLRHSTELLSQAPVGEIDSAGALTEASGPLSLAYYPLVLLDSQAGPLLGALMLWGLIGRVRGPRAVLLSSIAGGWVVFTFIAKKQVFYTLPILAPLAVLAASRGRWSAIGVIGGIWSFLAVGVGVVPGGPFMPASWVQPRHTLARPPTAQPWHLKAPLEAMTPMPASIAVFSQDHTLFEGFVALAAREIYPDARVRGVVLDPNGTFEDFDETQYLLWVASRSGAHLAASSQKSEHVYPMKTHILKELESDHYSLKELPPVAEKVAAQRAMFDLVGVWPAGSTGADVIVLRRR